MTGVLDNSAEIYTAEFEVWSFVLFNYAWSSSERTFGIKYDSYTRIKLLIMSIIITYYRHIYYHILAFISITNLLYFLIQVYFFEEGKNMGIITRCKTFSNVFVE